MPPSHECPGGCGARVIGQRLACSSCWFRLPREVRIRVNENYRRSAERHAIVVHEAYTWYHNNPLSDVDREQ